MLTHIEQSIAVATQSALKDLYQIVVPIADIQIQETNEEYLGDFTLVLFPFIKLLRKAPALLGDEIGKSLIALVPQMQSFVRVQGFLNITLKPAYWNNWLYKNPLQIRLVNERQKVMVEYSSPNTNKPLHLGHIRNNLLGYSVSQILKKQGHDVIMANLCNDRGIHISKSMLAWTRWGNGATPESTGKKGDHLVGDYYVMFQTEMKKERNIIMQNENIEETAADNKTQMMKDCRALLLKWEAGDEAVRSLWETMNSWVYAGFDETYKRLGVHFDKFYYESNTYLYGKEIIQDGLERGVFYKKDDGSVWVDLTDEGLDHKILLRSDGTSVYMTQDLGTAQQRFDEYNLDKMIYVVGNEQDYHFKVLKLVFKKLGRTWWNNIFHLSYGMVELPTGKMKTREGTVIDADDLITEMEVTAADESNKTGKTEDLTAEEFIKLVHQIALAAIKFFLLKAGPANAIIFNPAKSIEFQGFTGPYLQYSHARIKSILRKVEEVEIIKLSAEEIENYDMVIEEKNLIQQLHKHEQILNIAADNLSPASLSNYLFELAKSFSSFYDKCSVLREENLIKRAYRLKLTSITATLLFDYSKILGIDLPERM